jgi:hypothetical protein
MCCLDKDNSFDMRMLEVGLESLDLISHWIAFTRGCGSVMKYVRGLKI